jgi:hypothetical protein
MAEFKFPQDKFTILHGNVASPIAGTKSKERDCLLFIDDKNIKEIQNILYEHLKEKGIKTKTAFIKFKKSLLEEKNSKKFWDKLHNKNEEWDYKDFKADTKNIIEKMKENSLKLKNEIANIDKTNKGKRKNIMLNKNANLYIPGKGYITALITDYNIDSKKFNVKITGQTNTKSILNDNACPASLVMQKKYKEMKKTK